MQPDISIIIVNYNTRNLLYECLSSIAENISSNIEVVVLDNASSDDSFHKCKKFSDDIRFHLIKSDVNLGFAKGNNLAVKHSSGKILHFLNPDTKVMNDLNEDYQIVIADPSAVYVNPLMNPDGSRENSSMSLPFLKDIFKWIFYRKKARFWYKGASMIISRYNYNHLGGWSEDYFIYAEDLDFFYRFWMNSIPIKELKSTILHYGGGSSSNVWSNLEREVMVQRSNRVFYKKYSTHSEYVTVKLYFILHNLLKRPKRVPLEIRAWLLSK